MPRLRSLRLLGLNRVSRWLSCGRRRGASRADGVVGPGAHAVWSGYLGSFNVQVTDWLGVTLRGEWLQDRDGARTGFEQELKSFTTALLFKLPLGNDVVPELFVNVEWRYDRSNRRVFTDDAPSTTGEEHHRSQIALQMFIFF